MLLNSKTNPPNKGAAREWLETRAALNFQMRKKHFAIEFHPTPKEEAVIREIMAFCLDMGIPISSSQALRSLVTFGIELHLARKAADMAPKRFNGHQLVENFREEMEDEL